ncbi:hypothetical protein GRI97_07305 [Altererythrobacter xixiisoli]|uniref:Uncharacterized protein n=1 Tax=Croceibacterium xixiisoli TaxID=1476466 RepID=A0A6I4TUA8_9SPHN|nr:hypothetical protein [Croceibacterium xixiisoli]
MAMRLGKIWSGLLAVLIVLLLFAWYDGGREQQRLIEQPVELPGNTR